MHVKKIRAGGVNTTAERFIGEVGTIFYDYETGFLRLSDGHTPGGQLIYGSGPLTNQALFTTSSVLFRVVNSPIVRASQIIGTGTGSDLTVVVNGRNWIFNSTGGLTFPDGTVQRTAGGAGSGFLSTSSISFNGTNSTIAIAEANDVAIAVNSGVGLRVWRFSANPSTNYLQFPDGTRQATAFTGTVNLFNQSLNSYNNVGFNSLTVGSTATFAGNVTVNSNLTVLGAINFVGTVTQINVTANNGQFFGNLPGNQALYAGVALGFTTATNAVLQTVGNLNGGTQNILQNINNGNQATSNWVAMAANGSTNTNSIKMGITSGGWDGTFLNSPGDLLGANDGYVYVQSGTGGGNLLLGTYSSGTVVKIMAGNTVVATYSTSTLNLATSVTFPDGSIQTTAVTNIVTSTDTVLGGVKIGANINVTSEGTISVAEIPFDLSAFNNDVGYLTGTNLPTASYILPGIVQIGEGIQVNNSGTISVNTGTPYVLNTATASVLGGVKVDNNRIGITTDGLIYTRIASTDSSSIYILETDFVREVVLGQTATFVSRTFNIHTATNTRLGGIKVGSEFTIDPDGTLNFGTNLIASTGTRIDIISDGINPSSVYFSIDSAYVGIGSTGTTFTVTNVSYFTNDAGYLTATDVTLLADTLDSVLARGSSTVKTITAGHIVPATNKQYDLGSPTNQWKSLYVGTGTIYIGGVPLTINTTSNTLVIGTSTNTTSTQSTNLATENFVVDSAQDSRYTPDDADNWNNPTVTTIKAALNELAQRVTQLQNYEIDGGNAFTMATAELEIDGNNGV